jgi:hypothetical protein
MGRRAWWIVLGVLAVVAVGLGLLGYAWVQQIQDIAQHGKQSLESGLGALEKKDAAGAERDFADAEADFRRVHGLVGPQWLQAIPLIGAQLRAVDGIATIGTEGASAGGQAAQVLSIVWVKDAHVGVNALLKASKPQVLSAMGSLEKIATASSDLDPDGLLPPLADAVAAMQKALGPMQPLLNRAGSLTSITTYLLGSEHRFLVVSQNNTELRPTGGFMGTYGLLTVGPEGISLEKYADIYSLPATTLKVPAPPGAATISSTLKLRDANWWVDFPTSATTILDFYDHLEKPQPKVDGVIGIDLVTIKTLLAEFGPITLPEYGKTFTADNVIKTLTVLIQEELAPQGGQARKSVLGPLGTELLHRMMNAHGDQFLPLAKTLIGLADARRVQVFTRVSGVQSSLVAIGWSGAINPPPDTTDLLAVVNAVVWPSKMNYGVQKSIDYRVALNADGSADTDLTLGYVKKDGLKIAAQRTWFGNYLRVYRTSGTTLTGSSSTRSMSPAGLPEGVEVKPEMVTDATGLPAVTAGFGVQQGETRTEKFRNHVPHALVAGSGAALPGMPASASPTSGSSATMHYRLLMVQQADLEDAATTVTVTVPAGWKVQSASAWRRNSGDQVAVTVSGGTVTLSSPLSADTILDVQLVKA